MNRNELLCFSMFGGCEFNLDSILCSVSVVLVEQFHLRGLFIDFHIDKNHRLLRWMVDDLFRSLGAH